MRSIKNWQLRRFVNQNIQFLIHKDNLELAIYDPYVQILVRAEQEKRGKHV